MSDYWETRYAKGGTSGSGSRGAEAEFKAALLNGVIGRHNVRSVLDVGCGDGYVASMIDPDVRYVGYDPSPTAIKWCRSAMPTRDFTTVIPRDPYDMTASLDVIFHLVKDDVFKQHVADLFALARRLVFVYGTNFDMVGAPHVRHRVWLSKVPRGWKLVERSSTTYKDMWLFGRTDEA